MKNSINDLIASICCDKLDCPQCIYKYESHDMCDQLQMEGYALEIIQILKMIQNTDHASATKCFETINRIKGGDLDE